MITIKFKSGSEIKVGSLREAYKLRGIKYSMPVAYYLDPDDMDLLIYLHEEVIIPATVDYE